MCIRNDGMRQIPVPGGVPVMLAEKFLPPSLPQRSPACVEPISGAKMARPCAKREKCQQLVDATAQATMVAIAGVRNFISRNPA